MKSISFSYKAIAVASFLILSAVQFFLIYNTYNLKDEHYYIAEKDIIKEEYGAIISNELAYPGGVRIIDKYLNGASIRHLETLYNSNKKAFETYQQQVTDSMYHDLVRNNIMDSFMQRVTEKHHLAKNFRYALIINQLSVTFKNNVYIPLYKAGTSYPLIDEKLQKPYGILLGGTLTDIKLQNQTNSITVSVASNYTYKITIALHADTPYRMLGILKSILPILLLSLISIILVVFLFYITFRNWQQQKKLAEMKSDFVNSITHEFHTPLAAIMIANKNLQNSRIIEDKKNIGPLTDIIQRQSDRLKSLFEQVWDITNTQQPHLNKKQQSLHLLLDDILLDYRLKLTDSNIQLSFTPDATSDVIRVDTFWLTTMLTNLFDNALKYNNSSSKEIHVRTVNSGSKLILEIADNGIGMSPETQKLIFEKFYRHPGVLKNSKGLGVGLYYVKLCIDAHQWNIDINSEPGKGSRFNIIIPVN